MNGSSSLLPIFRSEAQFRVLGELYTSPGLEATIGELSARVEVAHPTVSREVKRLAQAGLVRVRNAGRQTLVSAEVDSPFFDDLRSILSKSYGALPVLREEFDGVAPRIVVFGSWAARWHGRHGPAPRDIDVLVLTDAPPSLAWEAAARASRRLGIEVNVVVRTPDEWDREESGFAAELARQPSIDIGLGPARQQAPSRPPSGRQTAQRWG